MNDIFREIEPPKVNFGFVAGRNCVLNALEHAGRRYVLSFDLESFFDSVTIDHIVDIIDSRIIDDCFIEGAPRQGLPTSPVIANISFIKTDNQILDHLRALKIDATYTRYVDDLTVSFDNLLDKTKIEHVVSQSVIESGFKINRLKTRFQSFKNGRIIITGVGVDQFGVFPTRKTLKKIRAAKHQGNNPSQRGLIEWSKCKLPKTIDFGANVAPLVDRRTQVFHWEYKK